MGTTLDTRASARFLAARLSDAVNIPLEELASRVHELPAAHVAIELFDEDAGRADAATDFLRRRGHPVVRVTAGPEDLVAVGPSRSRLWQPNPYLGEALARIGRPGPGATAIDVACGTGRDAVFLALSGYDVAAIDHLPDALERATGLARNHGVSIRPVVHDLERENSIPLAPADLVCVFRYLHRTLFPALRDSVRPGGYLVYETFHVCNLETGRSPRSPNHLLRSGELAAGFNAFDVLDVADAVERDGRFFSHLLARRRE